MIKAILLSVVLLASAVTLPSFDEFPAKEIFKGKPTKINLKSHKEARKYRTALTEGVQEGPNFAGHYTVVGIGCGSGCEIITVVDANNGKVFFPKQHRRSAAQGIGARTSRVGGAKCCRVGNA